MRDRAARFQQHDAPKVGLALMIARHGCWGCSANPAWLCSRPRGREKEGVSCVGSLWVVSLSAARPVAQEGG